MKTRRFSSIIFILTVCLLLSATGLFAQDSLKLTLDTMSDPSLRQAFSVPIIRWMEDNTALIYDRGKPSDERFFERYNPSTGKRKPLVDHKKAEKNFKALFPEDEAPRFSPIPRAINESGRYAFYLIQGDIFVLDLKKAAVIRITETEEREKSVKFSPNGERLAFVRENDLYAYDIVQSKEYRLTFDGSETILNGTLSWVYWEEVFGRQDIGYWWSGDSKCIAFFRTDESEVSIQHYVDIDPWTPTVTTQRYPKVGEKNPEVRLGLVEMATNKTTWVNLNGNTYEYILRVDWMPGHKRVCVRTMNRLQTEVDLFFVDRSSGEGKFIMKETDEGWINLTDDLYFLKDGKHFIMASERSGYEHLYRFTMDGKLVNQITNGEWAIRSSGGGPFWVRKAVTGIDEKRGWIYFTALEKSSLEKHLYRIRIDGTKMKRLTKGDGTHAITMSPNTRYYFDRYSNISTPPSLILYTASGSKKLTLKESEPAGFKKFDVQYAELFHIPARDGFMMPASITKPKDFDPNKKYPVIVYVYGGPSAPQVSNSFQYGAIWENVLLNEGYICMKVDHRVSTAISKKLENLVHRHAHAEVERDDLVDAMQFMKKKPFIDPDRFGIWGWSGGGTHTILLMTRSKEFKAGIAGAGVTDYRFYDTKWGETMMKTPDVNPEGFEETSLLKFAKDLHGKLMLVHGTHDDNVHIQNTWRFINELIKANKLFELMVYPMRKHGVGDRAGRTHLNHVMLDFWERNLKN
ncbi:S9 family peptidase [bacterium]